MTRKSVSVSILTVALLSVTAYAGPHQLYVSVTGQDTARGTASQPFRTLRHARDAVRRILKTDTKNDVVVNLRNGDHILTQTLVLGLEDSPAQNQHVMYQAFPGESPRITSGVRISGWKSVELLPKGFSAKAAGNLWCADVPKVNDKPMDFRFLRDGNVLRQPDRSERVRLV